jgi:DHA1 family tetracycline resistance protein-like MFS transporter
LLAFAIIAQIGLSGVLAVPLLFVLVLLSRGLMFGLAWAAAPVTAQSYVVDVTTGEAERVRGMSMFGAAQGLALAVGPALGGLLSFAGLLLPIYVAPVILGVIAIVLWRRLPKPQARRERPSTVKVSAFDRRMWPFLTAGFGMYLALTLVLMTVGFLLQDRMHLSATETGQVTGLVMLAGAGMIVIVQAVVIPRLGWKPVHLIQMGAAIMTVGMIVVTVAQTGVLVGTGVGVLGIGLGFGMPGIMSAPTLLATKEELSSVAGLLNAGSALTFMVGPLVGNSLYEIAPVLPYLLGSVLLAALTVFVFVHPGVRQAPAARVDTPVTELAVPVE